MTDLLLGQIPEAIYFALFMIFTKKINKNKILFIALITIEYIFLMQVLKYNIWSRILFFISMYIILKILYNDRVQIVDIFTLTLASLILIVVSLISYIIALMFYKNIIFCAILNKTMLFIVLFLLKNKLNNIQKLYKRIWNRNDEIKKKIKTTTFRAINVIIFNLMFYILNIGILFIAIQSKGGV